MTGVNTYSYICGSITKAVYLVPENIALKFALQYACSLKFYLGKGCFPFPLSLAVAMHQTYTYFKPRSFSLYDYESRYSDEPIFEA